jgi:hypothetical protein
MEGRTMTLATFLLIKAIISIVFGAAFALIPRAAASIYGYDVELAGELMSRYLGAALIGIGLICFLSRSVTDTAALQAVTLALFIGDTIGFVVALYGQFGPIPRPLGWFNVVIWGLLALGLGYFRFFGLS